MCVTVQNFVLIGQTVAEILLAIAIFRFFFNMAAGFVMWLFGH